MRWQTKLKSLTAFITTSEVALFIFFQIIAGAIIGLGAFLLFIDLAEDVIFQDIAVLDTFISRFIYSLRSPVLNDLMRVISFIGGEFLVLASIAIALLFFWKNHQREATLFSLTVGLGYVLNTAIKYILKIPRPDIDPVYIEKFYSFPSGHAMNSFIFFASLSYFMYHFTRDKTLSIFISILSGIMILLVGFSRVYLGVHYPSDVIAGFIVGCWWFVTTIVLDRTIIFYSLYKGRKKK